MKKRTITFFVLLTSLLSLPVFAGEVREDYSSYIDDIRSGKGNEANMPPELIKKLKEMGKEKRVQTIPEVEAPKRRPKKKQGVPSPKKVQPAVPPTDVLIIHGNPSGKK